MKKNLILILSILFLISLTTMSNAAEMAQGSMEEKGSMIEESKGEESMKDAELVEEVVYYTAKAIMEATTPDSTVSGSVDLIEKDDGIQVVAALSNVTPAGKHGIHIHENGSCENFGKAAGGHFNPAGTKHGALTKDGHDNAHTGDMGNIEIDDNGSGSLVLFLPGLSLSKGEKNVSGKAVILHAKEDDFGQPTGNAGGRIGCGIIVMNK